MASRVVITTHYMDEAEYCNRIALINGGRLVALGSPSELKKSAIRGEILLIEGDDPGAMLEALEGAPPARDVAPFGSSLHVVVDDARRDRAAIEARLAGRGLAATRIEPIKATLEDVFVQLVAGKRGPRHERAPIRAVARKEVIQILRDSRSLMVVLLMPLMQMALLGYGVNLDIKHVPICVFDREGSQESQALLKAFQASQYFTIVETDRDYAPSSAPSMRAAAAWRSLCRPISRRISPPGTQLRCRRSSTRPTTTPQPSRSATLRPWSAPTRAASSSSGPETMGQPPPVVPAVAQYRVWFNEDLVSRNFIIPGVVALVMALVGAQLTSLTISREWERGTMEVLVSTPVTRMELMAGKMLPYFIIGLLDAALCLVIAVYWFEAPFRGAVSTLFLTTSLFLIVVLGLGYFISASIRSQIGASQIALIVTLLPTTLLSGFAFPIEQMPPAIQAITYLVPARYYFTILKSIFLKGSGLGDLVAPIAFLAVYAVLMGWLASRAFRKTLG